MKSSLFNVYVPAKQGYAIYNTLNESILFCDEELKSALEKNNLEKIKQYISTLQSYGIVVENTEDELKMYQYRYNTRLCSTQEIQFVAVTTYTCNLACPYCYEGKGEVYSCDMTLETADRIVKVMQSQIAKIKSSYVTLILFGGEPLLNVDVGLSIAKKLREWCAGNRRLIRTFLVTNGTLLTEEKASLLKGFIDGVQLTFDGSQPYHDRTRIYKNGKGTYSEVYSAVKHSLGAGMKVSLRIQVSKENWQHLKDLFQDIDPFLQTRDVRLNIAPLSQYSGMCSNFSSHFLEKEEQETVLPAMLQYSPDVRPVPNYLPCVAYSNNFIFDGRGSVYRCITSVGEDKRVGYISGERIVWEPELYTFLGRTPLKIKGCSTCQYVPLCGGGCPRTALLTHNSYESSVCGGSRKVYSEIVSQYVRKKFPEKF